MARCGLRERRRSASRGRGFGRPRHGDRGRVRRERRQSHRRWCGRAAGDHRRDPRLASRISCVWCNYRDGSCNDGAARSEGSRRAARRLLARRGSRAWCRQLAVRWSRRAAGAPARGRRRWARRCSSDFYRCARPLPRRRGDRPRRRTSCDAVAAGAGVALADRTRPPCWSSVALHCARRSSVSSSARWSS